MGAQFELLIFQGESLAKVTSYLRSKSLHTIAATLEKNHTPTGIKINTTATPHKQPLKAPTHHKPTQKHTMKKFIVTINRKKLAFFADSETEACKMAARWWANKYKQNLPCEPNVRICKQWKQMQKGQSELCLAYSRHLSSLIVTE